MKYILISIRFILFMSILLGVIYPMVLTGISQIVFPSQANGSFEIIEGKNMGSILIAQKFEKAEYFWPRPSSVDYNPLPSAGSNLGQISNDLKTIVEQRRAKLKAVHLDATQEPPAELLFASSSGIDPHLSIEAINYQILRVSKARNLDPNRIQKVVEQLTEKRQLAILGEPKVNVLGLNMALDKMQ